MTKKGLYMKDLRVSRLSGKLQDFYKDKVDLSDVHRSDTTHEFLTRSLAAYSMVMKTGLSYDESARHIVDGFDDIGIDLIYRDDISKKLYLVQAKFYNDAKGSITQGDALKFCSGVEKIINSDLDSANNKIKNKSSEIQIALDDTNYRISLVIIYTSDDGIADLSKSELDKFCNNINDPQNTLIEYEVINLKDIYSALSNNVSNEINLSDVEIDNWGWYLEDDKIRGVYGVVSANLIGKWWSDYKVALLTKNIRNFKGTTDVNKGIQKTISESPENFIYFNNGIKIVTDKIQRKSSHSTKRDIGLFDIQNASVVNGAQTVGSIGEIYLSNPTSLESAYVFVQIISLDGRNSDFGKSITKLSNTQNRIESKDFVGLNNDFHKKLKEDFALDQIYYSYKAGDENSPFDKTCTIDEVAIAHGCYLDNEDISTIIKGRYGSIYDNLESFPYTQIFSNESTYLFWNCILISRKFDENLKTRQRETNGLEKRILINGNRFLLHLFFQLLKKQSKYPTISNQYLNESEIDNDFIKEFLIRTASTIKEIIDHSDFSNSYPALIFKNLQKCKTIKQKWLESLTEQHIN